MPSSLLFPRVWIYDVPSSAPKTSLNVLLSSVVHLCLHFLFRIDNPFDFWFGSSKTFAKSFNYFRGTTRMEYTLITTTPSFRVELPRTVCGSECLNVETVAPFVNIFERVFPFGIDIVETIVEWRLSLYYMSAVSPIAHDWALTGNTRLNL